MSVFSKSTKGLLVIPAAIACLFAGGPASAGTIFSDDFKNGASPLWGNNIGSWHAVGGGYQASAPSTFPNANSALPFDLADFSVSFDMLRLQDGGVWLRSAPATNGIGRTGVLLVVGGLGGTGRGAYWHIVTGNSYGAILDQSAPLFVPGHSDARLRVVVEGNKYALFVDGATAPATTLTTAAFTHGQVSLYDFWPRHDLPHQTFDDIAIRTAAVPEPATAAILAAGLLTLGILRRRQKRHPESD